MNASECIVKRVDTTGFAHKEILEVDNHRLAVYTKADTKLITRITGNTNTNGLGTETQALVNATGHLMVHSDSGFEIDAKTDAGVGKDVRCDDGGRLYAGLNAYTDISVDTSHKRVKCDANGKLEVVSSSGVSDLTARTTIGDAGTSTNLLCDATGKLSVDASVNVITGFSTAINQTNGTAQCKMMVSQDGETTGTQKQLRIDASTGAILVKQNDHASVLIQGVSDQADQFGTKKPVLIDTDGKLILGQLPASLGQKANASSMSVCRTTTAGAYDLSARTTIATASTTTKLLCSATGVLSTDQTHSRAVQVITTDSGGSALTSQIDGGESTASITMTGYRHMFISLDSAETSKKIQLLGSHDDTTFYKMNIYTPDATNGGWAIQLDNVAPKFVRIKNIDSGFFGFSAIAVFKTN